MSDTELEVMVQPKLKREKTLKADKVVPKKHKVSKPVEKVETALRSRKNNNWVEHVRTVAKTKNLSYKEAMKEAKLSYKKA